MKEALFTLCLVISAPGIAVSIALLALDHAVEVRNPFKILWHFLKAVVWGAPVIFLVFVSLIFIAFIPAVRPYGAIFLFLLNLAALVIIFVRAGAPKHVSESLFHLTPVLAMGLSAWIVVDSGILHSLHSPP